MAGPFPYQSWQSSTVPAPMCLVRLSWFGVSLDERALLDSGAEITVIAIETAGRLGLRKIDDQSIRGAQGPSVKRDVYAVDIDLLGFVFPAHRVVALPNKSYALIGRDILNRYVATLDGPQQRFSVA